MKVKEAIKITDSFYQNQQDAGPELQPASLGMQDWPEAGQDSGHALLWLLCNEG